ncbi:O-antigen ligase domain-containing protein [bacterium]|nr:MAG: O-antigen ligase domain-containing protein [bacterium]
MLFTFLPRSRAALGLPFEKAVVFWGYVASFIVSFGGLVVGTLNGVTIGGSRRLGEFWGAKYLWIPANNAGLYAALLILFSIVGDFLPRWIRSAGCVLGAYILLITQSRMTMLALILTLLFIGYLNSFRSARKKLKYAGFLATIAMLMVPLWYGVLLKIGTFQRLAERTQKDDPTTGRLDTFVDAIDRIKESPFIGHGYMAERSRFENGYLSMAVESGLIGLLAYLLFVAVIVLRTWPMLFWDHDPRAKRIARILLVLTVFLTVRSLGERSHGFQVSDVLSNVWMLLAGYVFIYRARLAQSPVIRRVPAPATSPAPQVSRA